MSLSPSTYAARRAAHQCVICTAATGGKALCVDCRQDQTDYISGVRAARFAAGLCTMCEAQTDGKHRLCTDCRKYCKDKRKAQYVPRVPDRRKRVPLPVAIVVVRRAA